MNESGASVALRSALQRIAAAATWHTNVSARRLGISRDEMLLLEFLSLEPMPQAQLGPLLGMSRSGIGAMVVRLECAGLIRREAAALDRRARYVMLTDETRSRLQEEWAWLNSELEEVLAELDVSSQEMLAGVLSALADASEASVQREREKGKLAPLNVRSIPMLWG